MTPSWADASPRWRSSLQDLSYLVFDTRWHPSSTLSLPLSHRLLTTDNHTRHNSNTMSHISDEDDTFEKQRARVDKPIYRPFNTYGRANWVPLLVGLVAPLSSC